MQPPRVWRTHYEDECGTENNIYSFSALKQYSSLVRIQKSGRYHVYGSAKLPAQVLSNSQMDSSSSSKPKNSSTRDRNGCVRDSLKEDSRQLKLDYDAQLAVKEIEQIMLSALEKIQQIVSKATASLSSEDKANS